MNLRSTLLLLIAALPLCANSQKAEELHELLMKQPTDKMRAIYEWNMVKAAPAKYAQKVAATKSRIVASAGSTGSGTGSASLQDSAYYVYNSVTRGGDADDLAGNNGTGFGLASDTGVRMSWDQSFSAYRLSRRDIKTFGPNNETLMHLIQTRSGGTWQHHQRRSSLYDAAGRDTLSYNDTWGGGSWVKFNAEHNTFSSTGDLLVRLVQVWNSGSNSYVNANRNRYLYDSKGRLALWMYDVSHPPYTTWTTYMSASFGYDAADNLTAAIYQGLNASGSMANEDQYLFSYNASNYLVSTLHQTWDGSKWENADSSVHTALNSNGYPTTTLNYVWNSGWQLKDRLTASYTASDKESSFLQEVWSGSNFKDSTRRTTFYNSYDQKTLVNNQTWDGSNWLYQTNDFIQRFYYALKPTVVPLIVQHPVTAKVFPIPATDQVRLAMQWTTSQPVRGTVLDVNGKVVYEWSAFVAGSYNKDIDVADLASGKYFVRVQGAAGYWEGSFLVVR